MNIANVGSSPYTSVQTGTFTGGPLGSGTFTRTTQSQGDTVTISGTRTSTSGQTVTDQISITRNADGSITRDSTYTNALGKSVQRDVTLGALQDDTRSVTGTITDASGAVDQVAGTWSTAAGGYNEALTLTNAAGQTATAAIAYAQTGSLDTTGITGTNFSGAAISQQNTETVLSVTNNGTLV